MKTLQKRDAWMMGGYGARGGSFRAVFKDVDTAPYQCA